MVVTDAELSNLRAYAKEKHLGWDAHSMPDGKHLAAVTVKTIDVSEHVTSNYVTLPDLMDRTEHLSAAHISMFPPECELTEQDTTYSAMNKVSKALGMVALHPLF